MGGLMDLLKTQLANSVLESLCVGGGTNIEMDKAFQAKATRSACAAVRKTHLQ